jgi:hypothetical protein
MKCARTQNLLRRWPVFRWSRASDVRNKASAERANASARRAPPSSSRRWLLSRAYHHSAAGSFLHRALARAWKRYPSFKSMTVRQRPAHANGRRSALAGESCCEAIRGHRQRLSSCPSSPYIHSDEAYMGAEPTLRRPCASPFRWSPTTKCGLDLTARGLAGRLAVLSRVPFSGRRGEQCTALILGSPRLYARISPPSVRFHQPNEVMSA